MTNIRSFRKLPKGKLTVTDLLTKDDVNDCLKQVLEKRPEMVEIIVAWIDKDGATNYSWSGTYSNLLWALKQTECALLKSANKED